MPAERLHRRGHHGHRPARYGFQYRAARRCRRDGRADPCGAAISTPPLPTGCIDTYTKKTSTHSVACSGQPSYTFGAITISGGVTVNFTMGAAYNFASGTPPQRRSLHRLQHLQ